MLIKYWSSVKRSVDELLIKGIDGGYWLTLYLGSISAALWHPVTFGEEVRARFSNSSWKSSLHLTMDALSTHPITLSSYRVKTSQVYHQDSLPFICTTLLSICQSKLHNCTTRKNELTPAIILKWYFFIMSSWISYVKDCSVTKHYTDVSIWVSLEPSHAWYVSSVYNMCFMRLLIKRSCRF